MTSELVAGRRPHYHNTDLLSGPVPHAVLSTVAIPTEWLSRHRTLQRTGRCLLSARAEVQNVPLSAGAICQIHLASLSSAATPSAGSGHDLAAARTSAM
jgi:hypothetical protein